MLLSLQFFPSRINFHEFSRSMLDVLFASCCGGWNGPAFSFVSPAIRADVSFLGHFGGPTGRKGHYNDFFSPPRACGVHYGNKVWPRIVWANFHARGGGLWGALRKSYRGEESLLWSCRGFMGFDYWRFRTFSYILSSYISIRITYGIILRTY